MLSSASGVVCMLRWMGLVLLVVWAGVRPVAAADAGGLRDAFDPAAFSEVERRLVQTGLAASGDFAGPIDGGWDAASQRGLAAYARREFGTAPLNLQAAALMIGLVDAIARNGWAPVDLPGLDLSLALPLAVVARADEDGHPLWRSRTGSLSVIAVQQTSAEAAAWHRAALEVQGPKGSATTLRQADRMITETTTEDGWRIYQRSEQIGASWNTVRLLAGPDQADLIGFAAASIARGQPAHWDLPPGGALSHLVTQAFGLLGPAAAESAATLVAAPPPGSAPESAADPEVSTGSGFYVGPRLLLTAAHVVTGCQTVALTDGTALELVGVDADRDVAALRAPQASTSWLGLAAPTALRLGQRVHAVGYPYFGLSGTGLNVAGGNVSALAGMDDNPRFVAITAPVQPGNSGGPLLDAHGSVAGLVVARLSESYIEETTGSLPQNVNYALTATEIGAFLHQSGLRPSSHPLAAFDMDDGAPPAIATAVVPLVCY